ncbi:MAG: DMT family transporter [Bacteroidaceae bacterium]|nr:DMT family transporter [Bacteroidaceae bacterium]
MHYTGELLSLLVAVSWTITAILSEYASKRMGSVVLNTYRMIIAIIFSFILFSVFLGSPLPAKGNLQAYSWMMLSGFVGYLICDYCLMKCYTIIGSRYGQLFMTLAPLSAAITAWITLGQELTNNNILAMVVTLVGICISILGRGEKHKIAVKLPLNGVLYAVAAGITQGLGLVISKIGMNYYEQDIPSEIMTDMPWMLPFCANFFRCIAGLMGFSLLLLIRRKGKSFVRSGKDKKALSATISTTIFGPFGGVALSLLALQYTSAGIASTIMAVTPIFILPATYFIFHQQVTWKSLIGAIVSVLGVSLFFLL